MKNFDNDCHYTVVKNRKEGSETFETYGEDLARVERADPKCVWTIVEDDEGRLVVIHGFHLVNRFRYIITKEPVKPEDKNTEYMYEDFSFEEEDNG
jgi:hypothetical protein